MSEKFNLAWDDYQSNWTKSLCELRKDSDSADVTLISDDKVKFSAHKILLSSCSNVFKFILKGNFHTSPLLFLSGISSVNLEFILDYIYLGEIKVFQNQLKSFLASAKKLEINGLLSDIDDEQVQDLSEIKSFQEPEIEVNEDEEQKSFKEEQIEVKKEEHLNQDEKKSPTNTRKNSRGTSKSDVAKINVESMTAEEIKVKMEELYEKIDGVWRCLLCEYSTKTHKQAMNFHIEKHLDGLSYTCTKCNKEFRYKNSLDRHKSRSH